MNSNINSTPNILYNIINYEESNIIFNYFILIIIFLFIFSNIDFKVSTFIGLIFCSIIIYYFYTYRSVNYIYEIEKKKEKFNKLSTIDKTLESYPDVVDIFYYIEDLRKFNMPQFDKIQSLTEQFFKLYEACNVDYSLINIYYQTMIDIKVLILSSLNTFIINTFNHKITDKLLLVKKNIELKLNNYLSDLFIIQEKNLYYNGYNNNTYIIDKSNVLPSNFLNPITYNQFSNLNNNNFIYD
jgi:Ca2+/Na+ antiporter